MASFNKRVIYVFLHPNVLYCTSVTIFCFIFLGEVKSLISTNILRFVSKHHDVSNRIIVTVIIIIIIIIVIIIITIIIIIIIISSLHFTVDSYLRLIPVIRLIQCLDTLYKLYKESP